MQSLKLPVINTVTVAGRLVADPKPIPVKDSHGSAFVLAFNRKTGNGSHTSFLPCIVFGDLAATVNAHLKKGAAVLVTGSLSQDKSKEKRLQISVAQIQFLSVPEKTAEKGGDSASPEQETSAA